MTCVIAWIVCVIRSFPQDCANEIPLKVENPVASALLPAPSVQCHRIAHVFSKLRFKIIIWRFFWRAFPRAGSRRGAAEMSISRAAAPSALIRARGGGCACSPRVVLAARPPPQCLRRAPPQPPARSHVVHGAARVQPHPACHEHQRASPRRPAPARCLRRLRRRRARRCLCGGGFPLAPPLPPPRASASLTRAARARCR